MCHVNFTTCKILHLNNFYFGSLLNREFVYGLRIKSVPVQLWGSLVVAVSARLRCSVKHPCQPPSNPPRPPPPCDVLTDQRRGPRCKSSALVSLPSMAIAQRSRPSDSTAAYQSRISKTPAPTRAPPPPTTRPPTLPTTPSHRPCPPYLSTRH